MQSPTPAAAPDPVATAAAQSKSNKETAVAQYGLGATNQKTPTGSLNYSQIGTWADGTPRFQSDATLTPEQEQLRQTGVRTQQGLGDVGNQQIQRIGQTLNEPVNFGPKLDLGGPLKLNTDATEARTMELARKRLDPILAQRGEAKKAELFNSGVLPGTEAYRRGILENDQAANDATNQLILGGHDSAVRDLSMEFNADQSQRTAGYDAGMKQTKLQRDQMFNEIASLLGGSQIQMPSWLNTPTPGVAPTDVIGAQQQSLNQSNYATGLQQQQQMGLINGMFGLGKTALGGWMTGGTGGGLYGSPGGPTGHPTGGYYG